MLACSTRLTSKIVPGASNTLGILKGSKFCNAGQNKLSKCLASAVLAYYTPAAVHAIHKIR